MALPSSRSFKYSSDSAAVSSIESHGIKVERFLTSSSRKLLFECSTFEFLKCEKINSCRIKADNSNLICALFKVTV